MNVLKRIQNRRGQEDAASSNPWRPPTEEGESAPYVSDDPVRFWKQQKVDVNRSQTNGEDSVNVSGGGDDDQSSVAMSKIAESSESYFEEAPLEMMQSESGSLAGSTESSDSAWRSEYRMGREEENGPPSGEEGWSSSSSFAERDDRVTAAAAAAAEREGEGDAMNAESDVESELETSTEIFESSPTAEKGSEEQRQQSMITFDRFRRLELGSQQHPESVSDASRTELSDSLKSQVMSSSSYSGASVSSRLNETSEESVSMWPLREEDMRTWNASSESGSSDAGRRDWEEQQQRQQREKVGPMLSEEVDDDAEQHDDRNSSSTERRLFSSVGLGGAEQREERGVLYATRDDDDDAQRSRLPLSLMDRNLMQLPARPSKQRADLASLKSRYLGASSPERDSAYYVYEQLKTPRDRFGRPKRNRLPPLEFWRNERVVYGHRKGELIPSLIGVIRNTSIPTPMRPPKRRRALVAPVEAETADPDNPQYGTISAPSGEDGGEQQVVVALKTPTWKTITVGNPKALIADSFGGVTGWVKLLSGSRQEFGADPKQSKVFFVQRGQVSVKMANKVIHISPGGTVLVPPNHPFFLANISKGHAPCLLAFVAYPGDMLPSDEVL